MKVLIVSSGNSKNGISPIVKNQGESLRNCGLEIVFYPIKGKGVKGYLKSIYPLKRFLKDNKFDIIHAHYSMSAFVVSLARANPIVVSLMGSDVKSKSYYKFIISFFYRFYWSKLVVKSIDMMKSIRIKNVNVIPNGVDFSVFKPLDQIKCKKKLGWNISKRQILFAANSYRPEKNYSLAKNALSMLQCSNCELISLEDIPNEQMPIFFNAADVILLTSLWEGSPNVIKEAMACNRPIVSTNVGDIEWLLGNETGHFLTSFNPLDVAEKLNLALKYSDEVGSTNGCQRIAELKLDSKSVAEQIVNLYKSVIK